MSRLIVKTLKPRNPWVAASLRRHAGVHRRGAGGMRQQARQALQHELNQLRRERHSP